MNPILDDKDFNEALNKEYSSKRECYNSLLPVALKHLNKFNNDRQKLNLTLLIIIYVKFEYKNLINQLNYVQ